MKRNKILTPQEMMERRKKIAEAVKRSKERRKQEREAAIEAQQRQDKIDQANRAFENQKMELARDIEKIKPVKVEEIIENALAATEVARIREKEVERNVKEIDLPNGIDTSPSFIRNTGIPGDSNDPGIPGNLTKSEIIELDTLERQLEVRRKRNPLAYLWPHQRNCDGKNCKEAHLTCETYDGKRYIIRGCPQYEFLNSWKDINAYFGSNRAGKTTAGAAAVCMHATGFYPDWYKGRRWKRPTIGRVFASDFAKGVKVVTEKLREWMPKDAIIRVDKNTMKAEVNWWIKHLSGGISYFDVFSYEQDPSLAEGVDLDWALFDEPPPRSLYIATARGLVDRDGITLFTLTPLKEPWLFDEIYNSRNQNIFTTLCDIRHNSERLNPLSKRIIGLPEKAIRKFEEKLTEEERETRIHGKMRYLAGRIWKEWDRGVHTFNRFETWVKGKKNVIIDGQPPQHWPRCLVIDPHDRNPHALLWIAIDETEESWIYREAYLGEKTIDDVVDYIRKVELEAREKIQLRIMDPNFGPKRYGNTGQTVRDEFEQAGRRMNYPVRFMFGNDSQEIGHQAVAQMLKFDTNKPLSLTNHPRLHMASDLKECIYQIEHYIWDDYRDHRKIDSRGNFGKESPQEINSHFPDTLRYYSLANFRWTRSEIHQGVGNFYGASNN